MHLAFVALLACQINASNVGNSIDTIVVCPQGLEPGLQEWLEYRQGQGHTLAIINQFDSAGSVREQIRRLATDATETIVIVGDVSKKIGPNQFAVPTHFAKAEVNIKWGSEPEIATDNWYADLNDDDIPELAVGRISVDSPDELKMVVRKIIDYETSHSPGLWRRRVNFVAGVGGFGALADSILERCVRTFITKGIPPSYRTSVTYASWRSPFFPDPRSFRNVTTGRMNEGCLFWVYIGHGHRHHLDLVRVPIGTAPIFETEDIKAIEVNQGSPIAVFLSCYAGAFDHEKDCLAEQLITTPKGPVASICGSRITMPYAMTVMANEMLKECFRNRCSTIGQIMLNAKKKMVDDSIKGADRWLINALASAISPDPDKLAEERHEHLHLFNLLGDPLLRLRHPRPVEIKVERRVNSNEPLDIEIASPVSGLCTIEVTCPRGELTFPFESRKEFDGTHQGMRALDELYRKANNDRWMTMKRPIDSNGLTTRIHLPPAIAGSCWIRCFVEAEDDFAMGAEKVFVRAPKTTDRAIEQTEKTEHNKLTND